MGSIPEISTPPKPTSTSSKATPPAPRRRSLRLALSSPPALPGIEEESEEVVLKSTASAMSVMSTPTRQSRLGPGFNTAASPLPAPGTSEAQIWKPGWSQSPKEMWNRGRTSTRSSISEVSPLTSAKGKDRAGSFKSDALDVADGNARDCEPIIEKLKDGYAVTHSKNVLLDSRTMQGLSDSGLPNAQDKSDHGSVIGLMSPFTATPTVKHRDGQEVVESACALDFDTTPKLAHQKSHQKDFHTFGKQSDVFTSSQRESMTMGSPFTERSVEYGANRASTNPITSDIAPTQPLYPKCASEASLPLQPIHLPSFSAQPSIPGRCSPADPQETVMDPTPATGDSHPWSAADAMNATRSNQRTKPSYSSQAGSGHHGHEALGTALVPHTAATHLLRGSAGQAQEGIHHEEHSISNILNPFADNSMTALPASDGVIKIGNIPYSSTKQDVWSALGKTAKVIAYCPIHIIMERSTAKTMDCFIEFLTVSDARAMIKKFERMQEDNRPAKIGLRAVEFELTSQRELLKALFPRAKCVDWTGGNPNILPNTDPYSTGFQGFVTREEMHQLVRHAEVPARAPYSTKCPQRPYECMISTLCKFPWQSTRYYTNEDRLLLFKSARCMVKALCHQLRKTDRLENLDEHLLRDVLVAIMNCPGVGECEKVYCAQVVYRENIHINLPQDLHQIYRFSSYASQWPFEVLGRKKEGVTDAVCEFYFGILNQGFYIKEGGTDNYRHNSRFMCYVNHEDREESARTMDQEIAREQGVLHSLLQAYLSIQENGSPRLALSTGTSADARKLSVGTISRIEDLRRHNQHRNSSSLFHQPANMMPPQSDIASSSPFPADVLTSPYPVYPSPMMPTPVLPYTGFTNTGFQSPAPTFNPPFLQPNPPPNLQGFTYSLFNDVTGAAPGHAFDNSSHARFQPGPFRQF